MGQNVSKDFESLIEASATGDINKLKAAIEAGADVNGIVVLENPQHARRARQIHVCSGDTPLHVAIRYRESIERTRQLIDAGADVNIINRGHGTLFSVPAGQNNIECVKMLIEAGADVNTRIPGYGTPLCLALMGNNIEWKIVKMLVNAGADVNTMTHRVETPLYVAVRQNNIEYVKFLIEAGADVNSSGCENSLLVPKSPLTFAVNHVHVECLKVLLDGGADVNSIANSYDLENRFDRLSSMENKIRCFQLLSGKGAHVNQQGFWDDALKSFLSFLGENEYAMKGVKLIMATGADCGRYVQVKASTLSLRNVCREVIRRHLLSINGINLFVRVPQLPLPVALKSYLLYDVTLDEDYVKNDVTQDEDYVANDVTDDVEFIRKNLLLSHFEAEVDTYCNYDFDSEF